MKMISNVVLNLSIHEGRFIHWSVLQPYHYGCCDQVEQLKGSELSKGDKQTFQKHIIAGKREKTNVDASTANRWRTQCTILSLS